MDNSVEIRALELRGVHYRMTSNHPSVKLYIQREVHTKMIMEVTVPWQLNVILFVRV